jgi:hypothetical protein
MTERAATPAASTEAASIVQAQTKRRFSTTGLDRLISGALEQSSAVEQSFDSAPHCGDEKAQWMDHPK